MGKMEQAEMEAFLQRPLTAVLTTSRPDGSLHSAPIWFEYAGGKFYFSTGRDSVKARNLGGDPRASACIATHEQPYQYVSVAGPCSVLTEGVPERCFSICRRYFPSEDAARAFADQVTASGDTVVLRLEPARLLTEQSA